MDCNEIINAEFKSTTEVSLKDLKNNYEINDEKYNYVLEESYKLMPILLIQYNYDFKMMLEKIKEYQIILIEKINLYQYINYNLKNDRHLV